MSRENRRQLERVFAILKGQGWDVRKRRNNHYALTPPDGGVPYFCSGTPSDARAIHKIRSGLRKKGADL